MSIVGSLSTDAGIRQLDDIISVVTSNQSEIEDAITELSLFFCRHFKTGLLPFSKSTKYPSPVQRQVYTFIDLKFKTFCNFVEKEIIDETISKNPKFQNFVYEKLLENLDEKRNIAIDVLTKEFPDSERSNVFSELFLKVSKMELTNDEIIHIFDNFESILHRVDDQLITFDFLNHNINKGPIIASMAIPYLVDVSLNRAIDVPDFYSFAFKAISPESLSYKKRIKFFDMLSRVLSPKSLQSNIPIAFAVKLSRMLLEVSPDVQLDILSLLQYLVRAHTCVEELLEPKDLPLSNVNGSLSECKAQTLWEVRALQNSPVNLISEAAKTLGQRRLPPEYCSFNLKSNVESCKTKTNSTVRFNWADKLDKNIWD